MKTSVSLMPKGEMTHPEGESEDRAGHLYSGDGSENCNTAPSKTSTGTMATFAVYIPIRIMMLSIIFYWFRALANTKRTCFLEKMHMPRARIGRH